MAVTTYGVNDPLAVKRWSRILTVEANKATPIAPLIGKSKDSIIVKKTEPRQKGDKITFALRTQLTGVGKTEGQTLEGNEESLTTFSDDLYINELRHAVRGRSEGTIDDQRVLHNARDEARSGMRDWYSDRMSLMFFMQAGGYTGTSITVEGVNYDLTNATEAGKLYGFNAPTAPSTNRVIRAGAQATDQALTSADYFTVDLIDLAIEKAKTANPRVAPARINGAPHYVLYLHPFQVKALWMNPSSGQWRDAVLQAGTRGSGNPLFKDALGMYRNVIIRESEHVVTGVHGSSSAEETDVRRALFLGQQAVCFAQPTETDGDGKNGMSYKWREESFDYAHDFGVSASTLWGMTKTVFNSEDFGVISIHTYAAAGVLA